MSNKYPIDDDDLASTQEKARIANVDAALERAYELAEMIYARDEDLFIQNLPSFLAMPEANIAMNADKDPDFRRGRGDGTGGQSVTLLELAAQERLPHALQALISAGGDLAAFDILGKRPIHGMISPALDNWECLRVALAAGASPSAPDKRGATPLHLAILGGRTGASKETLHACSILLAAGADIFAADLSGLDPMAMAFKTTSGNWGSVLLLDACPEALREPLIASARASNEKFPKNGGATWALVEAWALANAALPKAQLEAGSASQKMRI